MAADKVKHITLETIEKVIVETRPKSVGIADMGCSSGPNTLSNVKEFVGAVEEACRKIEEPEPEFRFYLNDLPANDFNTIFQALPDFYNELKRGKDLAGGRRPPPAVYIAGFPGTFYGRVFPNKSLHLVYSSYSLHWLSRVPLGIYDERNESINKESIYISRRSSREVNEAYLKQFQEDFSLFLKSRSQEVINGGKMVLILLGRNGDFHVDRGISLLWEILYQSLATLVDQGEVEEGKLECYEVNFYAASKEELEEEVRKEGSFKIDVIEKYEGGDGGMSYGKALGKAVRSIQEPMIARHFGLGERILDKLFDLYGRLVDQELAKDDHIITSTSIVLVLTKLVS
ncbi:S-adenosyl-L-methionine-dependent methyltransferases superfamily protein [Perilla frutescens var. hirtella]|nr:S-adenosyl-L-methionine-dependent methyltransferases superfamily protein [Perilla frutescens var. hirtella]